MITKTNKSISEIANSNFDALFTRTVTAREMALTSHNLSQCGKYARTKTSLYVWSDTKNLYFYVDKN